MHSLNAPAVPDYFPLEITMDKPVTIRRPYRPSDHVATETEDSPPYNPHRVELAKPADNATAPAIHGWKFERREGMAAGPFVFISAPGDAAPDRGYHVYKAELSGLYALLGRIADQQAQSIAARQAHAEAAPTAPLGDLIKSRLDLAHMDTPTLAKELARRLEVDLAKTPVIESPAAARTLTLAHLGGLQHEMFGVMFLNSQHQLIKFEPMFRGSISATSVYPREVVKEALACNAAAVILAHNHPSGSTEPSRADESLTKTLKDALALVDVRVLDHFIVAGSEVVSFAERGLL